MAESLQIAVFSRQIRQIFSLQMRSCVQCDVILLFFIMMTQKY